MTDLAILAQAAAELQRCTDDLNGCHMLRRIQREPYADEQTERIVDLLMYVSGLAHDAQVGKDIRLLGEDLREMLPDLRAERQMDEDQWDEQMRRMRR